MAAQQRPPYQHKFMTGAKTAARMDASGLTACDTTAVAADLAPVSFISEATSPQPSPPEAERGNGSPLRERMVKKVAYWRSLRALTDEQEAALEFWENYLARNPAWLAAPREVQKDVSEPVQLR